MLISERSVMKSVEERFWSKVNIPSLYACWEWTASKQRRGYGRFKLNSKPEKAHRIAWSLVNGKIPEGMCILHKCDNPPCVNPLHLFLGTHADNMKDMRQKNRFVDHQTKKTHCPQGHPYSGANLYKGPDGSRQCRICRKASKANWQRRRKNKRKEN
jgi:hypothetical protein